LLRCSWFFRRYGRVGGFGRVAWLLGFGQFADGSASADGRWLCVCWYQKKDAAAAQASQHGDSDYGHEYFLINRLYSFNYLRHVFSLQVTLTLLCSFND
jgi:hypothetical protein